jgi:type II secretory pathway predicted ATPase ExeA
MDYLNSLQCKTEPFVTPSGTEIFLSQANRDSIEKLSHYVLLGAGLNLVIGTDGSGKTTLLNELSRKFSADKKSVVLLMHDPQFSNLQDFLITLTSVYKTIKPPSDVDDETFQKAFNAFFLKLCQQGKKTILLLIDNGHNLPDFCLQALRSFYDYHPDCRRFLQTVIGGAPSIKGKIDAYKTLGSRIVFTAVLKPFSLTDTRKFIRFHLEQAAADPTSPPKLFSIPAQWAIFRLTKGHPKAIIDLCHLVALTLVIENRGKAGWFMALRCAKLLMPRRAKKLQLIRTVSLSGLVVIMMLGLWSEQSKTLKLPKLSRPPKAPVAKKVQQQPKSEATEAAKIVEKTSVPEEANKVSPAAPEVAKETPPVIPSEKQAALLTPAEKPAAVPDQPETKTQAPTASAPGLPDVAVETAPPEPKPVPKVATIVTPAIRERREVRPGDTFLTMVQQVYGPGHLKPDYLKQVIAANPHLRDPDNLEVGDQIFFPVLATGETRPVVAVVSESPSGADAARTQTPVDSPELATKPFEPPEILGEITTARGENFGDMVRKIYGPWSFNKENVTKVLAVNPKLKSPELLYVGYKISFPTIPVALTPKAEEAWWVRITTFDNIQSAYRFLRQHWKSSPPMLIIPSKVGNGQTRMNILLEEFFMNEESAQKAIQGLPSAFIEQAEALHGLSAATFYYRMKGDD